MCEYFTNPESTNDCRERMVWINSRWSILADGDAGADAAVGNNNVRINQNYITSHQLNRHDLCTEIFTAMA